MNLFFNNLLQQNSFNYILNPNFFTRFLNLIEIKVANNINYSQVQINKIKYIRLRVLRKNNI